MRYQFLISAGAQGDMHQCRVDDRYAAAHISALLREITSDEGTCEALIDDRAADDVIESVTPLGTLQNKRINAYRVRLLEVGKWRLITAVDHPGKRVGLFAVMRRSDDYERHPTLWSRVEKEYDGYGFPRY